MVGNAIGGHQPSVSALTEERGVVRNNEGLRCRGLSRSITAKTWKRSGHTCYVCLIRSGGRESMQANISDAVIGVMCGVCGVRKTVIKTLNVYSFGDCEW